MHERTHAVAHLHSSLAGIVPSELRNGELIWLDYIVMIWNKFDSHIDSVRTILDKFIATVITLSYMRKNAIFWQKHSLVCPPGL